MRLDEHAWMAVEEYLRHDHRVVLPLGSTEQHGHLQIATDTTIAQRLALEAAEPLGVAVLPALPYGHTPAFAAYPGSPSLAPATLAAVVTEIVESLHGQGFRGFLLLNGHSGNEVIKDDLEAWARAHHDVRVDFWTWFFDPQIDAMARTLAPDPSHANWLESHPWTRVPGVEPPALAKPLTHHAELSGLSPQQVRETLGDGSYGGEYRRPDDEMAALWDFALAVARGRLEALAPR